MSLSRNERGGVLVLFTVLLPVLVLFTSFVLDVGNWFEHKRHLQMQADSAALAAALDLRPPCSDAVVGGTAAGYSGRDYNAQVQNKQPNVHMAINSRTYYNQASPVDTTVDTNPPCTAKQVDVKLTEVDLPWYFRAASVPFINAHARVGLYTVDDYRGSLPLAVPSVEPRRVVAQFIDEDTQQVIGTAPLAAGATVGGLVQWDNSALPLAVKVDRSNIGVRVIVSGDNSIDCSDPLVQCFNGVDYVRGWTGAGSATQPNSPIARSVTLERGTCTDPYFNYLSTSCSVSVRAKLDFGGVPTSAVTVTITGSKPSTSLTFDNATGTWVSGAAIPVAPGAGPVPVSLDWSVSSGTINGVACTTKKPCTGTFTNVQRSFSGSDTGSGPIRLVDVSESNVPDTDSIERCSAVQTNCTHNLVVTVGLLPSLGVAQSINDPIVTLRFSGGGSQSQGLDCDPNLSLFKDELAYGCAPAYTRNTGTTCPANASALFATPNPPSWQCVANQTGQYVNAIPDGLNRRVLCPPNDPATATNAACQNPDKPTACTHPNNWSQFNSGLPADDTRIVQLFVTQYNAFAASGSYTVPITRFATFYITGWGGNGNGFTNPCQGNGDDPAATGTIVGHFIKYIDTLDSSTGTSLCDFAAPDPCVPVMTV